MVLKAAPATHSVQGGTGHEEPQIQPYRPALDTSQRTILTAAPLSGAGESAPPSASRQDKPGTYLLSPGQYYIISPNYPAHYPNNISYAFPTYTGAEGQPLRIHCPHVDLEAHQECSYDWLSINGAQFCGNGSISERRALTLSVEFHADGSVSGGGFLCYVDVPALCCGRVNRDNRIMGGVETKPHEYPWQAGVVAAGKNRTWCGGSLVNDRYVLTAAHCVVHADADQIEILLGNHWINATDDGRAAVFSGERRHPPRLHDIHDRQ